MNKKILLVDDEEGIRKVLGITLRDMGYDVLTAENGIKAIEIFLKKKPPIVLTDIKMPGLDGIDLLRKIKQENPHTEVIVITGHGDMNLAIKSLKYEATDFITKPIEYDCLEKALGKAHERMTLRQQMINYTENLEDLLKEKTEKLVDVSKIKEAARTSQKFQHLFDELPGYVTVHDKDFRLTAGNRQFRQDMKFDPDLRAYCHEILKGAGEPCEDCPVQKTFIDGKTHQKEMKYITKAGKKCNLFSWTTPLQDESGDVVKVMMMSTDISQIINLRDHLSSLGLMIGSMSHGIKGLLTGLDGGVYMIDSGYSKDNREMMSEGLQIVKLMVGRIKNMVLDILHYAKERDIEKNEVNILSFAEDAANVIESKVRDIPVKFIKNFDSSLADKTFEIDADQLRTAMINLLENAIDACIEDRSKKSHEIRFGAKYENKETIFTISDNGTGMTEKTQEKIFNLFFSSKSTRGTGIGLFVTKKIVRQHGGEITVDSTQGEGTCFCISIPGKNMGC